MNTRIALRAAACCHGCKLATADAIVYATALETRCDVPTCDAHFGGLPHVLYVRKS
ncbi:MAG TPA: hypothetical protein VF292_06625 [Rhodanobacteraceae bacterium]